jgi:hypothetical protein
MRRQGDGPYRLLCFINPVVNLLNESGLRQFYSVQPQAFHRVSSDTQDTRFLPQAFHRLRFPIGPWMQLQVPGFSSPMPGKTFPAPHVAAVGGDRCPGLVLMQPNQALISRETAGTCLNLSYIRKLSCQFCGSWSMIHDSWTFANSLPLASR